MATFNRRKSKSSGVNSTKTLRAHKHAAHQTELAGDDTSVRPMPRRGIYLLPNAFTTAALFCGFYAIVMAMNLKFDQASIAIFAASIG